MSQFTPTQLRVLRALTARGGQASISAIAVDVYGSDGPRQQECVRQHITDIRARWGHTAISTHTAYQLHEDVMAQVRP